MLCRRLNQILHIQTLLLRRSHIRSFVLAKSKCQWRNSVFGAQWSDPMSSSRLRLILRDFTVTRLWNACFRTQLVSSVVRRCRRERVRDVWLCFRHLLRPSRTLLLAAAYNRDDDDEDDGPAPCSQDISDEDLEALVHDFEGVDELSRTTLFCEGCSRRLVIDKQHPGVTYCSCSGAKPPGPSADGWTPYMEADDVVIWRKEYKPGGLFAYKVYGRYKDLNARDFAMIQVDGAYRRSWDDAVAALSVVEREANGVPSQAVLHWEVLWPRLFANRDYVYLRRHKEFEMKTKCLAHKEAIFSGKEVEPCKEEPPPAVERPNVHARAKLKAMELDKKERRDESSKGKKGEKVNKVFVIVSRSCTHPAVPETRGAVRVQEYWSHMVVRTLDGPDEVGMEFVLTYYDEPSVGGLPAGVSAWATGRAAPSYLARMRRAALHYAAWRHAKRGEMPDFEPFDAEQKSPRRVDNRSPRRVPALPKTINELDMESSKSGPELDEGYEPRDKSTQTDPHNRDVAVDRMSRHNGHPINADAKVEDKAGASEKNEVDTKDEVPETIKVEEKVTTNNEVTVIDKVRASYKVEESGEVKANVKLESEDIKDKVTSKEVEFKEAAESDNTNEEQSDEPEGDEAQNSSWWRYLYPFYYFV